MPARDRRRLKEVQDVSATPNIAYIEEKGGEKARKEKGMLIEKSIVQGDITDPLNHSVAVSIHDYLSSKQIKLPDSVPASAGGLNKTSKHPLPSSALSNLLLPLSPIPPLPFPPLL